MAEAPILIVDDDPLFRETVAAVLTLRGFPTRVAADGRGALEAIETERPSLMLLHVSVSRLGGEALLEELAARKIDLPVVIVTDGPNGEAIARKFGVAAYLRKPIALSRLLDAIAACGDTRPDRKETPGAA